MASDDKSVRTRAECVEDVWLTVSLLASLAVLFLTAHPVSAAIAFVGSGIIPVIVYRGIATVERRRLEIGDLDVRPAREFVRTVAERFRSQGYRVRKAAPRHANAFDFMLRQHGRRILVQVTPSREPVGPDAVRRLLAALPKCRAETGWIVTNAMFAPEAEALAGAGPVALWDRFRLTGFLLETCARPQYSFSEDVAE